MDEQFRQHRVKRAESKCEQRQRHAWAVISWNQQSGLQREHHQRRAEHQAAIDQVAAAGRLLACVQDRDQQVEGQEQQQEGFGAGQLGGVVLQYAPQRADAKGEDEAQQVQHPPRPEPGDGEDGCVQHCVVRKQRNVAAAAGGQPDRCHEAGQDAEHRQRLRVLQHRQRANAGDQDHADGKGRACIEQSVKLERGKDRQQQHADSAALQRQRKRTLAFTLAPAEHQAGQRRSGDAGQAQLDGQGEHALVHRIFQQRGHAGQQHQHADLDRHVANREPAFHCTHGNRKGVRPGSGRWLPRGNGTWREGGHGGHGRCRRRRRQWWRRLRDGGIGRYLYRPNRFSRLLHGWPAGQLRQGRRTLRIWRTRRVCFGRSRVARAIRALHRRGRGRANGRLLAVDPLFKLTDAPLQSADGNQRHDQQDRYRQQHQAKQNQYPRQIIHSVYFPYLRTRSVDESVAVCNRCAPSAGSAGRVRLPCAPPFRAGRARLPCALPVEPRLLRCLAR